MSYAVLRIEQIGNPRLGNCPAWVKRITGVSHGRLQEDWVHGNTDYSAANSVGSRGVYRWYMLQYGDIYHVRSPLSWKRADDYYCRVEQGVLVRMSINEVIECVLNRPAAKMSTRLQ
ncbi:MAG TPA: hypothetical protein VNL15_06190 [Dehalococcoidia bacterium]|nr:hypothetical protein [Dehalococcoidia bacterium]